MNIRASQVYVSRETRRKLSVIARAEGREATADSIADRFLSEYIASRYPALAALEKKIEEIEAEMIQSVKDSVK